jgi:hypothetical protein
MKFSFNSKYTTILASVSGAMLVACGGGQSGNVGAAPALTAPASTSTASSVNSGNTADVAAVGPTTTAASLTSVALLLPPTQPVALTPMAPADLVTDIKFESTAPAGTTQASVPVTFGHVFTQGDVLVSNSLVGKLPDGTTVPLQMDIKATHPDGSVRHAVLSAVLPNLAAGETRTVNIGRKPAQSLLVSSTPDSLLSAGFTAKINLTLNNQIYTASADELLKNTNYKTWLAGSIANEWIVLAPLKTATGAVHPHLTARFAIRWYSAIKKARVDVTIENAWVYEAAPQDFTYNAQVLVGDKRVYEKTALTHFHHARWRKMFWWGEAPQVHIRHNTNYLISTRAVPNYDQTVVVSEASLAALRAEWTGPRTEPMGVGMAVPYMPTTGGRRDIGLLPSWSAMYLLSMDKRAKDVMLGTADLAGSWSAHYRNKVTDRPVSLKEFPYMTILGNPGDTYNPATKLFEKFPSCAAGGTCANPSTHDTSHQPAFAYLPYLITGDYYYLEELQFWAMWNILSSNPYYRSYEKGLVISDQVRGEAWTIRTLAEATYVTPDADPLKSHFNDFLSANLDWFNDNYTNNASANKLGALFTGYNMQYGTQVQPWMDDFFTSAVGHTAELGFAKAKALLTYKAKFPVERMTGANACWIDAAIYYLVLRDTVSSPFYTSMQQTYAANHTPAFTALPCAGAEMAASLNLKAGEMTGYSTSTEGYPSNMQPALAYSVDSGVQNGKAAWKIFMSRSVKPNYGPSPQFAIIPR